MLVKDDWGVRIERYLFEDAESNTALDLTGAISVVFNVRGVVNATWPATIENSANGLIYYVTQEGDITCAGKIRITATVTFPNGKFTTPYEWTYEIK